MNITHIGLVGYGEVGIEETRWLPKGHTVGSARPVVLRRPNRVAVLPATDST